MIEQRDSVRRNVESGLAELLDADHADTCERQEGNVVVHTPWSRERRRSLWAWWPCVRELITVTWGKSFRAPESAQDEERNR